VSGILVIAEHLRGQVRPVTLELVSVAKELGDETAVAVIANDPASLADQVDVDGVAEIVSVKVDQDEFENDVYREAVEQLISARSPEVVLVGFTVNSMGFAPALAAKLGLGFASDVFGLRRDGEDLVASRAFYGSKVNAEIGFPGHERVLLMVRPTAWPPAEGAGSAVEAQLEVTISGSQARHKDFQEAATGDVTSPPPTSCSRWAAGWVTRRTSGNSRTSPSAWAPRFPSRGRSSTRGGCRTRGRSASPGRR